MPWGHAFGAAVRVNCVCSARRGSAGCGGGSVRNATGGMPSMWSESDRRSRLMSGVQLEVNNAGALVKGAEVGVTAAALRAAPHRHLPKLDALSRAPASGGSEATNP